MYSIIKKKNHIFKCEKSLSINYQTLIRHFKYQHFSNNLPKGYYDHLIFFNFGAEFY